MVKEGAFFRKSPDIPKLVQAMTLAEKAGKKRW